MDIVEDIRAYLLADADFNRAWTDGRRGPGHLYQDASYKARRIELAERRERWAAEQAIACIDAALKKAGA